MIKVRLLDPEGLECETVSGEVPEVTGRVADFARAMIGDGLSFSVEVVRVDTADCPDCGTTPTTMIDGTVFCAGCFMPSDATGR